MPTSPNQSTGAPDPAIREPAPAEVERVRYLFGNLPLRPEAGVLVAVRSRPVERFVAAVAWWAEGPVARFQLACRPGVARAVVAGPLLEKLTEAARGAALEAVQYASLLAEGDEWFGVLRGHGFGCLHSERSFEVSYQAAWNRVMRLYERHRSQIPAGWRTEGIRGLPPETALGLIAPHRLMPPAEVCGYWRAGAQGGFEPDASCVLFDGDQPFGTFLVRRLAEGFYIDVQVVREANPRLRSLGDLLMLYHGIQRVPPDGPCRWLWFRSGQTEHRQTANLALRLGGRELARGHLLGRKL